MSRSTFKHWITEPVRWGDMDALGHVNNAVYFVFCESVRMSFFLEIDLPRFVPAGENHGPALVTATCNFKQQVHHPATLDVGLRVARLGGKSFTLEYGMFRAGSEELVADGSSVVVWVDYGAGASLPIPESLRPVLESYGG